MPSNVQGPLLKRAWYAWKSYSLPWRRQIFVGEDLEGNTYWEFKDRFISGRPRRIVHYKNMQRDLVDYKLTPQWHQWLRATRNDPPSITELQSDISRLVLLRHNAALADARWAAKPSLLNVGPHPPAESVLESNTKFSNDSGMQKPENQKPGRGEVGADLGGKGVERRTEAGESTGERAHGLRGLGVQQVESEDAREGNPWKDADKKAEGFKPGVWDPNTTLPKFRPGREDGEGDGPELRGGGRVV